ncbi:MAG: hypothetical protein JNK06_11315 [Candidatus Accumulibacter phosphatis]|uniref:hypothetical protein n=1 Tax=Candidatus Accumulibacter phosphatis TaxID=327160 RepID=UPI001A585B9B|nr:hypothetical protein [Candidatus Accumulibacter phosphatis]
MPLSPYRGMPGTNAPGAAGCRSVLHGERAVRRIRLLHWAGDWRKTFPPRPCAEAGRVNTPATRRYSTGCPLARELLEADRLLRAQRVHPSQNLRLPAMMILVVVVFAMKNDFRQMKIHSGYLNEDMNGSCFATLTAVAAPYHLEHDPTDWKILACSDTSDQAIIAQSTGRAAPWHPHYPTK